MNKTSILVLFCILFVFHQSFSQVNPTSPIEKFDDTPLTKEIALKITENLSGDSLKLLAIYDWITQNISYDSVLYEKIKNSMYVRNSTASRDLSKLKPLHTCSEILNKKRTICLGYAYLFSAMCNAVGIKNAVVKGYGRTDSLAAPTPNHAWVAFRLSDKWYLADPTWDSGIQQGMKDKSPDKYDYIFLMQEPETFLETHYPLDPLWQLQTSILSIADWQKFNKTTNSSSIVFSYVDSLKQYEKNSAEKNFISSLNRIIKVKEYAFVGHFEYCGYFFLPMYEEISYYSNLNRRLNTGNKNIEEMAGKILPRKKELFERLAKIEFYIKRYNYHVTKLTQVHNPFDSFPIKDIPAEIAEIKRVNNYLVQERNSLTATIKELEPYQKKSTAKK